MVAWIAAGVGLLIVITALTIAFVVIRRRLPIDDPDETAAYLKATGRSISDIEAGRPGHAPTPGDESVNRWRETAGNRVSIVEPEKDASHQEREG